MAALCGKIIKSALYCNVTVTTACRQYSKVRIFHNPLEHMENVGKRELLAHRASNDDPYNAKAIERRPSSREDPNLVPSISKERMIGCVCEEDSTDVKFMWVFKDEPTRCECGHWFQLTQKPPNL